MKTDSELQRLVTLARDLEVGVSAPVLADVADLVLRLHQDLARRKGAILPPAMLRSFRERDETERLGMVSAVRLMVLALVLLDLIELPT